VRFRLAFSACLLLAACSEKGSSVDKSQALNEKPILNAPETDLVVKCIADQKSDAETKRCISGLLNSEEAKMIEILATVKNQGAVDINAMSASQKAWKVYAVKHCEVREAGSFDSIRKSCLVEKTRERSEEIGSLVID
jgi:uncharacterized protein YecT (DUF1311 family)